MYRQSNKKIYGTIIREMNEINTLIVYMIFIFFIWANNSQSLESLVKGGS